MLHWSTVQTADRSPALRQDVAQTRLISPMMTWWLSDWEPLIIGAAGRWDYSIPAYYSYIVLPHTALRQDIAQTG
jgi:hypothetical protein